ERLLQRGYLAVVALEVVGLDVVHHRDGRRERQKRPVVLVRLHDVELAPPNPRVPAPPSDTAAGESRGIPPGGRQRLRDHHRGGRLTVRARHGDHRSAGDGLAEGVSPPYHRDPEGACSRQLRVVSRYRRGDHERPNPRYVPWVVTPPYFHPDGCQIGGATGVAITTGDRRALLFSEERQAAHAGSG